MRKGARYFSYHTLRDEILLKQFVAKKTRNRNSSLQLVKAGVPQESILSSIYSLQTYLLTYTSSPSWRHALSTFRFCSIYSLLRTTSKLFRRMVSENGKECEFSKMSENIFHTCLNHFITTNF